MELVSVSDTRNGYGWISIALHWITAVTVVAMLAIGLVSQGASRDDYSRLVHLHTTIGIGMYALLWGRIVWRFRVGHPGPLPRQGRLFFTVGKYFHFLLLAAIGVMLVSGPLMAWAAGDAIYVFDLPIPSPLGDLPQIHGFFRRIHGMTASVILAGLILHVLAVFKHTVINRDGTFDKIMIADRGERP
jgi:cytochrome b561